MKLSVPNRNTGKCSGMSAPYMLSGGPNWELQGKCYIILAGTTVLSGGPNWEKSLRKQNLCSQQSRRSTYNLVLGF